MRPRSERSRPHLALRARYRDGEIAVEARERSAIVAAVVLLCTVAIVALVMVALR
jgi:hypothetical protein